MRLALVVICVVGCGRLRFDELTDGGTDGSPDPGIVDISMRGSAPCVRSGDGRLACWGSNDFGQLGRGTTGETGEPELVALPDVIVIATGENSAMAIDVDGALWGWGANAQGQLGIGTTTTAEPTPQRVTLPPVVEVAIGEFHACAITEQDRELYCWGENPCGQLGTGDNVSWSTPHKVPGVSGATRITVSDLQTCFVDATNTAQCMGGSYFTSSCENQRLAPTPPTGLPPVVDIVAGCHASVCAVDVSGGVWCWGDNIAGVLGDGAATARRDPSAVAVITNGTKVSTGFNVSCAATNMDAVFCWGANLQGQLGIGNMTLNQSNSPLQVPFFSGIPIDQIDAGCSSPCVRSGHDIYCWGANQNTVIDDTAVDSYVPKLRTGLPF